MALRMVSRFYLTYPDAVQAVADLTTAGVPDADIALIESEDDARLPADVATDMAQSPARTGATLGVGIGGGLGALLGVGAISIEALQPVVELGWVVPTVLGGLIGAAIGALVGRITKMGVTNRQAHSFAEGLQRGEHLVMVRVDESRVPMIEGILARTHVPTPPEVMLPGEVEPSLEVARENIQRDEERIQYQ